MGEVRTTFQESAMGVSGQGEQSLSPKTQKNDTKTYNSEDNL